MTAVSTTSNSRKRFVADNGRVSMMRTTSPIFASFCSSCALNFLEYFTRLPYNECFFVRFNHYGNRFYPFCRKQRVLYKLYAGWRSLIPQTSSHLSIVNLKLSFTNNGFQASNRFANLANAGSIF